MGLDNRLRDLQDTLRNRGWRIKHIPWMEAGQLEMVYNTPLTLLMAFGGLATFFTFIGLVVTQKLPVPYIAFGFGGLGLILVSRIYAAGHKYKDWKKVRAKCLDKEIREVIVPRRGKTGTSKVWAFRLLCEYEYRGFKYKVTPETDQLVAFSREASLRSYLEKTIDFNNLCTLWVNTENPLQTRFNKKAKI